MLVTFPCFCYVKVHRILKSLLKYIGIELKSILVLVRCKYFRYAIGTLTLLYLPLFHIDREKNMEIRLRVCIYFKKTSDAHRTFNHQATGNGFASRLCIKLPFYIRFFFASSDCSSQISDHELK